MVILPLIIWQGLNFLDKHRKKNKRNYRFETFFCWIQVTDIRQRDSLQTKKSFDTPIWPFFLSNLKCPYGNGFHREILCVLNLVHLVQTSLLILHWFYWWILSPGGTPGVQLKLFPFIGVGNVYWTFRFRGGNPPFWNLENVLSPEGTLQSRYRRRSNCFYLCLILC